MHIDWTEIAVSAGAGNTTAAAAANVVGAALLASTFQQLLWARPSAGEAPQHHNKPNDGHQTADRGAVNEAVRIIPCDS